MHATRKTPTHLLAPFVALAALAALVVAGRPADAQAYTLTTLATFDGTSGAHPRGGLTLSADGTTLYGTTEFGGDNAVGTVFSVPVSGGPVTTLASFNGQNGSRPFATLTLGQGGVLYGTTLAGGGGGGASGYGTVFSLDPSTHALSTLAVFDSANGSEPDAGLVLVGTTLYGTTYTGGANNFGTVFSVPITGGGPTTLAAFFRVFPSCFFPECTLTLSPDGTTLYGTATAGGENGRGAIFSVPLAGGTPATLASFDNAVPFAGLTPGPDGHTLYGTTTSGGDAGNGMVYAYDTVTRAITTLASLTSANGDYPYAGLALSPDGSTLIGAASDGGGPILGGTLFSVPVTGGPATTLVTFDGTNGASPYAGLTPGPNGTFYGTTFGAGNYGGAGGNGTVFALTPVTHSWSAVAVSAGADGYSRLLWDKGDGTATVWKVDASGNLVGQQQFGPYVGWTARDIATGRDNQTRLLWTNTDGTASYYLLDADNAFVSQQQYGPYTGWTAQGLAVEPDNTVRALWANTDGHATVWTMDRTNHLSTQSQFGPYTGWTAKSLTVNPDGTERLLWTNADGTATFWHLSAISQVVDQHQYEPYSGYTATGIVSAPDGTGRVVWVGTDAHIALWTIDANNLYAGQNQYGPYSGWSFTGIGAGGDGNARLLWDNVTGQSALWSLTPGGAFASNTQYGPY